MSDLSTVRTFWWTPRLRCSYILRFRPRNDPRVTLTTLTLTLNFSGSGTRCVTLRAGRPFFVNSANIENLSLAEFMKFYARSKP